MNPELLQAFPALTATIIILLALLLLVAVIVIKGFRIVRQAEVMVTERFGRYHKTLTSGVNIIIPLVDIPRRVTWRRVIQDPITPGKVYYQPIETERLDLRENVYDFPRQNVITKDNVTLEINALLYFQITDPVRALYEVANLPDAIEKLTQTTLRNVIGEMDLDETLSSRDTINTKLRSILDEATDKWGVKVNRVELQDINPPPGIREDMEKQMRAERERRALVLSAEGKKSAFILEAEGDRQSKITKAEGERQAMILSAEGEAQARIRVAEAEAQAIKTIVQAAGRESEGIQYLVALKYIDALKQIAQSPQKTVFLPFEATSILGSLGGMKKLLEHVDVPTPPAPPRPRL